MTNNPTIYTPEQLRQRLIEGPAVQLHDGRWVLSRPLGWFGLQLRYRLRLAWLVFTGRVDVLAWPEQPQQSLPKLR